MEKLDELVSQHTFGAGPDRHSIPREWEILQPERMEKAIQYFTNLTPTVYKNYETLIKLGRRKLYAI